MDKLSKKYNIELSKGAGDLVNIQGKEIVKNYGENTLYSISKINFKNTQKILNNN